MVVGLGGPASWVNEDTGQFSSPLPPGMPVTQGLTYGEGLVVPGETLTAYADVYNSADVCSVSGGVQTCPNVNHQVQMSWQVQCNGQVQTYSDTQTVTAPALEATETDPSLTGALATFRFTVPGSLCAQGSPRVVRAE